MPISISTKLFSALNPARLLPQRSDTPLVQRVKTCALAMIPVAAVGAGSYFAMHRTGISYDATKNPPLGGSTSPKGLAEGLVRDPAIWVIGSIGIAAFIIGKVFSARQASQKSNDSTPSGTVNTSNSTIPNHVKNGGGLPVAAHHRDDDRLLNPSKAQTEVVRYVPNDTRLPHSTIGGMRSQSSVFQILQNNPEEFSQIMRKLTRNRQVKMIQFLMGDSNPERARLFMQPIWNHTASGGSTVMGFEPGSGVYADLGSSRLALFPNLPNPERSLIADRKDPMDTATSENSNPPPYNMG